MFIRLKAALYGKYYAGKRMTEFAIRWYSETFRQEIIQEKERIKKNK
jgi:hypothetical protein